MAASFEQKEAGKRLFEALRWGGDRMEAAALEALSQGANANLRSARKDDGVGSRPLHAAAKRGSVKVAAALLAAGAKCDAQRADGSAPLHIAAASREPGALAVMEALAEAGADLALKDSEGKSALARALDAGRLEQAGRLLELGARWEDVDDLNPGPLREAIARLDEKTVEFMLKAGVEPEREGRPSPFLTLMGSERFRFYQNGEKTGAALAIFDHLIAAGANPLGRQRAGHMEIDDALCAGVMAKAPDELLRRAQAAGCEMAKSRELSNWRLGPRGLASGADPEKLARALEFGLDANWEDARGSCLAKFAMDTRDIRMTQTLRLLLEAGANPDKADDRGYPLLFIAAHHECQGTPERLVGLLLEYGADPNAKAGLNGASILAATLCPRALGPQLAEAPRRGYISVEAVRLLLEAGADPNVKVGEAPLLAAAPRHCARWLIEKGADTDEGIAHMARTEDAQQLYSRHAVDQWIEAGAPAEHLLKHYPAALARSSDLVRKRLEEQGALAYLEAMVLREQTADASRLAPKPGGLRI